MGLWEQMEKQYNTERKTEAFYKTQGFSKLWLYVRHIVDTEPFQKNIQQIRNKHAIPESGYDISKIKKWTHPYHFWKQGGPEERKELARIRSLLRDLCKSYSLLPRDWLDVFESYLFYNRTLLTLEPGARNLCVVSDALTKRDGKGGEITDDYAHAFPVLLHISPYASKRDILDYIRKVYSPEIERVQKEHKNSDSILGKQRKRSPAVVKRNAMMYRKRLEPDKAIFSEIQDRKDAPQLKRKSVNKTLQREKKRRGR